MLPQVLLLFAAFRTSAGFDFDYIQFGPDALWIELGNAVLVESSLTLQAPTGVEIPKYGDLSLWVGMNTDGNDLVQIIADSWPAGDTAKPCYKKPQGAWCVYGYTYVNNSTPTGSEDLDVAIPGQSITSHYIYEEKTGIWYQEASIDGRLVSRWSSKSGRAMSFYTTVECCCNYACGDISAHNWTNGSLRFKNPVKKLDVRAKGKAVLGDYGTKDGGYTWTISSVNIPATNFK